MPIHTNTDNINTGKPIPKRSHAFATEEWWVGSQKRGAQGVVAGSLCGRAELDDCSRAAFARGRFALLRFVRFQSWRLRGHVPPGGLTMDAPSHVSV